MIKASKLLIDYIDGQENQETLADSFKLTRQTIYNIKNGGNVSSDAVAGILNATGFDFEKAFEVKE